MPLPYTLIRSRRKSLTIQIRPDGELIARAPLRMSVGMIEGFIQKKIDWITKHQGKMQEKRGIKEKKNYSEKEIQEMKSHLREYLIYRVQELWKGQDLPPYTSIKVTRSEHRWGSCSGKNGLCFSYRLAEYLPDFLSFSERESLPANTRDTPTEYDKGEEFIDAIIVHELAHLREKNHQKPFWNLVYRMMPGYEEIMKNSRDN